MTTDREVWEWLDTLANRDETVNIYMNTHRREYGLSSSAFPIIALSPAALVGLVETLVNSKERLNKAFTDYVQRNFDPPILLVPDEGLKWCKLDAGQLVSYGEWPKTERAVIESGIVYFRDFLRSLWRRLRRRPKSW